MITYKRMSELRVKYTVSLPTKVAEKLEKLAEAGVMSKPETLRRAIALYSFVQSEVIDADRKLCVVDKDDTVIKEVVFS